MTVRLDWSQRRDAIDAAKAKAAHVAAIGARSLFDADNDQLTRNVLAYEAEIAASVVTGIPWRGFQPITQCHDGDLDGRTEVRHSRRAWSPLVIRPRDKQGRAYILVTGADGLYDVRGWAYGADTFDYGEWVAAEHNPYWRIRQRFLRPMSELRERLNV